MVLKNMEPLHKKRIRNEKKNKIMKVKIVEQGKGGVFEQLMESE